jgi:hypothetical protein
MKGAKRALDRAALRGGTVRPWLIPFDKTIVVADPGAADGFASAVLAGLPQGNLWIGAALAYFTVQDVGGAGLIAAFQGNFSIGTTPTADATLTTTDIDIINTTAFTAAAGVTPRVRATSAALSGNNLTDARFFDNTDGSLELNGNITLALASQSAQSTVRVRGEVYLVIATMGDD